MLQKNACGYDEWVQGISEFTEDSIKIMMKIRMLSI